ncbi:hypothetical protein ACHAWC_005709 [Mediolabrus comicus]
MNTKMFLAASTYSILLLSVLAVVAASSSKPRTSDTYTSTTNLATMRDEKEQRSEEPDAASIIDGTENEEVKEKESSTGISILNGQGSKGGSDQGPCEPEPITAQLNQIISESLDQLKDMDFDEIIIENEIVDNTYLLNQQNGFIFSPVIDVTNNMTNALYDNNNAESQSGNVMRQNGVADFQGSLTDNNNAYTETGDVIRQNGILVDSSSSDEEESQEEQIIEVEEERMGSTRRLNERGTSISSKDGTVTNASSSFGVSIDNSESQMTYQENAHKSSIIIRNKISGNVVTRTKSNGIIVEPNISVLNDMSGGLHGNNNAKSIDGDVSRQNGVADFRDALNGNNNAYATEGDVIRQNGIMNLSADDASEVITPDLVSSLQTLLGGENLMHFLSSTDAEAVNAILSNNLGDDSVVKWFQEFFPKVIQSLLSLNVLNGGENGISIVELLEGLQEIIKRDNDKILPKDDDHAYSDLLNLLEKLQFDSNKGSRRRYLRGIGGKK